MSQSTDWTKLPKVELHLHLDCSMSFEAARELEPELSREAYEEQFIAPPKCTDLMDLLRRVDRPLELMQSEDGLRLATRDLFDQLAADNVVYAEIRFAPLLHTMDGLTGERVLETVLVESAASGERTGVDWGVIVCTLRHFGNDESMRSAALAAAGKAEGVVGFDIAGNEAGFSLDAHEGAFDVARESGLSLTAHAGEARGAESVEETLERLAPQRIGHGVRAIERPRTVARLRADGVHLEVCPTSNVQSDVCSALPDHPVERLRDAGVSLSLNTDGRTLCGVSLADEYARVSDAFSWSAETIRRANRDAIRASFASAATKKRIEALLGADDA